MLSLFCVVFFVSGVLLTIQAMQIPLAWDGGGLFRIERFWSDYFPKESGLLGVSCLIRLIQCCIKSKEKSWCCERWPLMCQCIHFSVWCMASLERGLLWDALGPGRMTEEDQSQFWLPWLLGCSHAGSHKPLPRPDRFPLMMTEEIGATMLKIETRRSQSFPLRHPLELQILMKDLLWQPLYKWSCLCYRHLTNHISTASYKSCLCTDCQSIYKATISQRGLCQFFRTAATVSQRGLCQFFRTAATISQSGLCQFFRTAATISQRGLCQFFRTAATISQRGLCQFFRTATTISQRGLCQFFRTAATIYCHPNLQRSSSRLTEEGVRAAEYLLFRTTTTVS